MASEFFSTALKVDATTIVVVFMRRQKLLSQDTVTGVGVVEVFDTH